MLGEDNITQEDLVVSKSLGQDIIKNKNLFPHISAAIQLCNVDIHRKEILSNTFTQIHSTKILYVELYQCTTPKKITEKQTMIGKNTGKSYSTRQKQF